MTEQVRTTRDESDVVQPVQLRLVHEAGPAFVDADLVYCTDDPYAVSVIFKGLGQAVTWTFGRELLVGGINTPSGVGDVQLWPSLDDEGNAVVMIELDPPGGFALLEVCSSEAGRFLQRTLDLVPLGCESSWLDVDGELTALFS